MSLIGALLICFAAILWGIDGVILTPRLFGMPVPFAVFLLHIIPFLIMQPFLHGTYKKLRGLSGKTFGILFFVSLSGGFIGTYAIVNALFLVNFNHLSIVVLLQKLQPIFAIILAAILLKERIRLRFILLAIIALFGAYLLTFGSHVPDVSGGEKLPIAAVWAIIAAACFGSATVFGKMLLTELDFKEATFSRYGMTSLIVFLFLIVSGEGFPVGSVTSLQWGITILIGLTTGSGAIFLYYFGLKHVKASVSTICELCLPLTAFILDGVVNKTVLEPLQWFGAAILIIAITSVSLYNRN